MMPLTEELEHVIKASLSIKERSCYTDLIQLVQVISLVQYESFEIGLKLIQPLYSPSLYVSLFGLAHFSVDKRLNRDMTSLAGASLE